MTSDSSKPQSEWLKRRQAEGEYFKSKPIPPKVPAHSVKVIAPGRDTEYDIASLEALLDCEISAWEMNFCKSVLAKFKHNADYQISDKQAAIVDKLDKKFLTQDNKTDPTPQGNPPAQLYTKTHSDRVREQADVRKSSGFDDMDDDIPF